MPITRAGRAAELPDILAVDVRRPIQLLDRHPILVHVRHFHLRGVGDVTFLSRLLHLRRQALPTLRRGCPAFAQQRRDTLIYLPLEIYQEVWVAEVLVLR
ncbi:hypothetical protein SLE2022_033540 [Rubroshorea leprosula]